MSFVRIRYVYSRPDADMDNTLIMKFTSVSVQSISCRLLVGSKVFEALRGSKVRAKLSRIWFVCSYSGLTHKKVWVRGWSVLTVLQTNTLGC